MPLNLWAFGAVTVPLVATPGASTAVVLRNSLAGGIRSGAATAAGANTASVCYGLLTAFGVAAALHRWPLVWIALRIGGALYLAWLGLRSLHRARTGVDAPSAQSAVRPPQSLARSAREGFVTNVLNPSLAAFYLLVIPEFIPRGAAFAGSVMMLTAIHVGLALGWHLTWAAAGGALSDTLSRPRPRRALEAISGIALLALAVKVAI